MILVVLVVIPVAVVLLLSSSSAGLSGPTQEALSENARFAVDLSRLCHAEFDANGPFGKMSQIEFHSSRALSPKPAFLWNQLTTKFSLQQDMQDDDLPLLRGSWEVDSFDWRDQGAVSKEVHDQGSLGTCAAFATVGNIEARRYLNGDGVLETLSVEQIVECSADADTAQDAANCGVFGGWPKLVLEYAKKRGIASAKDWPYCSGTLDKKMTPQCFPCMPEGYSREGCDDHDDDFYCKPESTLGQRRIDGWCGHKSSFRPALFVTEYKVFDDTSDEERLREHLRTYGPLAVTISIGPLQLYRRGIMDPPSFICPRRGRPGELLCSMIFAVSCQ